MQAGGDPGETAPPETRSRGRMRRLGKLSARAGGGAVDQGLWALTNVLLILVVASQGSLTEVGAIGLILVVYAFALLPTQAVTGMILVVRFSEASSTERARAMAGAAVTAAGGGLLVGSALCVMGVLEGGELLGPAIAIGAGLPFLMVQDVVRYGWFSARRPWKAAFIDVIWLLVSVAGYGVVIAADLGTTGLAVAWSAGGALAGLVGVVQLRIDLRLGRPVAWVREHWILCRNFFGEALMFASVQLGLAELLRFVGGLEDVGIVRLAVALTGPLRVVIVGAGVAMLPEAIRRRRSGASALIRFGVRISVGLAIVAALWTTVLQLVPDSIGDSLLGPSWDGGQRMALPAGLSFVAIALGAGSLVGIRSHRPELSYRGTAAVAALSAAGFCTGLLVFDAFGALVGHAIGTTMGVAFAWAVLLRALRDYPVEAEDELAAAAAAEVELRGPLSA